MPKIEFETPPLGELLVTPPVQPDAMAHSRPFVAKPEHQKSLGFPSDFVDNWQDVALAKRAEILGKYRSLPVLRDACDKSGRCHETLHHTPRTE